MGRRCCSEVFKERVLEEKRTSPSNNRSQPFKEDVVLTLGDALRLYYLKGGINTYIRDVLERKGHSTSTTKRHQVLLVLSVSEVEMRLM